jgi:hypothetical protein
MQIRTEIVNGKRKVIITRSASGIDRTREAVLSVMGKGYKYKTDKPDYKNLKSVKEEIQL